MRQRPFRSSCRIVRPRIRRTRRTLGPHRRPRPSRARSAGVPAARMTRAASWPQTASLTLYPDWPQHVARLREAVRGYTTERLALRAGPDHDPVWALAAHVAGARACWLCGDVQPRRLPRRRDLAAPWSPRAACDRPLAPAGTLTDARRADAHSPVPPSLVRRSGTRGSARSTGSTGSASISPTTVEPVWHATEEAVGHRGRADPVLGVRVGGRARARTLRDRSIPTRSAAAASSTSRPGAALVAIAAARAGAAHVTAADIDPLRGGRRRAQCPRERGPRGVRPARPARRAAAGRGRPPRRGHLVRGPARRARPPVAACRRRCWDPRPARRSGAEVPARPPASRSSPATTSARRRRSRTAMSSRRACSRSPEGSRLRCAR